MWVVFPSSFGSLNSPGEEIIVGLLLVCLLEADTPWRGNWWKSSFSDILLYSDFSLSLLGKESSKKAFFLNLLNLKCLQLKIISIATLVFLVGPLTIYQKIFLCWSFILLTFYSLWPFWLRMVSILYGIFENTISYCNRSSWRLLGVLWFFIFQLLI